MSNQLRLDIQDVRPFADGHEFGAVGAYQRIAGRVHFSVAPLAPAQAGIVDLDKAPLNADGLVECVADFMILKPADLSRGNQKLFFDYGNRGSKRALQFFCDAPASNDPLTLAHAGNRFLFERGYTIVWLAWHGGLHPGDGRLILDLPVAYEADGSPIIGTVRVEYLVNQRGITTFPLSSQVSTMSYPVVTLDTREASLTRRRYADDPRENMPPESWCFGRQEGGRGLDNRADEMAIVPSNKHIHLFAGFEPGWIYELVYTARDPLVHGLGHLVVRDFVSFLKHADRDSAGTPNPLAEKGGVEKAYCWGRSQTGRAIRDFLYRGFNADADGRKVFDGAMPHVSGARLLWMNHRFANVISPPGLQYEQRFSVVDAFPYAYAPSTDPDSGRTDSILKRPDTDPLLLHTQTATEYWQGRGSLVHTDPLGDDLPEPENVRIYCWASSQHFADPRLERPTRGVCQQLTNPVQTSMLCRAMLVALDAWASDGILPPPSRHPRRADGTLLPFDEWRAAFPAIPGVNLPRSPATLLDLDWGPQADSGILVEPPAVRGPSRSLVQVPAVDADGNEIAGVRAPMVQAPLGTYTGWNLRARGHGTGALYYDAGSYVPLPDTPEERSMTGDPRLSVLERYPDSFAYRAAIRAACEALVAERLMLAEDVEPCVSRAANWGGTLHEVGL